MCSRKKARRKGEAQGLAEAQARIAQLETSQKAMEQRAAPTVERAQVEAQAPAPQIIQVKAPEVYDTPDPTRVGTGEIGGIRSKKRGVRGAGNRSGLRIKRDFSTGSPVTSGSNAGGFNSGTFS